jgi:hypothetical protein
MEFCWKTGQFSAAVDTDSVIYRSSREKVTSESWSVLLRADHTRAVATMSWLSYASTSIPAVATFSDLFARLDPDARVRGKQFEHVCKWFLINDPTYKNILRRVWLWGEWTGRWGGDAGIDLVAEDHDGRLWAIQAKAYAPENTVTKADVDKVLAESSRAAFSYRLLIATTDKLHHVARRSINDQEKQVAFIGLSDLLTSEVNWRTNPFDMHPSPPPKPAKPREHQREAIRDVVKGFTKSDRGQLIMACGAGKTLSCETARPSAQRWWTGAQIGHLDFLDLRPPQRPAMLGLYQ